MSFTSLFILFGGTRLVALGGFGGQFSGVCYVIGDVGVALSRPRALCRPRALGVVAGCALVLLLLLGLFLRLFRHASPRYSTSFETPRPRFDAPSDDGMTPHSVGKKPFASGLPNPERHGGTDSKSNQSSGQ